MINKRNRFFDEEDSKKTYKRARVRTVEKSNKKIFEDKFKRLWTHFNSPINKYSENKLINFLKTGILDNIESYSLYNINGNLVSVIGEVHNKIASEYLPYFIKILQKCMKSTVLLELPEEFTFEKSKDIWSNLTGNLQSIPKYSYYEPYDIRQNNRKLYYDYLNINEMIQIIDECVEQINKYKRYINEHKHNNEHDIIKKEYYVVKKEYLDNLSTSISNIINIIINKNIDTELESESDIRFNKYIQLQLQEIYSNITDFEIILRIFDKQDNYIIICGNNHTKNLYNVFNKYLVYQSIHPTRTIVNPFIDLINLDFKYRSGIIDNPFYDEHKTVYDTILKIDINKILTEYQCHNPVKGINRFSKKRSLKKIIKKYKKIIKEI